MKKWRLTAAQREWIKMLEEMKAQEPKKRTACNDKCGVCNGTGLTQQPDRQA